MFGSGPIQKVTTSYQGLCRVRRSRALSAASPDAAWEQDQALATLLTLLKAIHKVELHIWGGSTVLDAAGGSQERKQL